MHTKTYTTCGTCHRDVKHHNGFISTHQNRFTKKTCAGSGTAARKAATS